MRRIILYILMFSCIGFVSGLNISDSWFSNSGASGSVFVNGSILLSSVDSNSSGVFFDSVSSNGSFVSNGSVYVSFLGLSFPNNDFRNSSFSVLYSDVVNQGISFVSGLHLWLGAFVSTPFAPSGGAGSSIDCSAGFVVSNGLCVLNVSSNTSLVSYNLRFGRDRFIFSEGVVSFNALVYADNVLASPSSIVADISLSSGIVSIPLRRVDVGSYLFEFDFSSVNVSSVDVVFLLDDGRSTVLPLNFLPKFIPLFLVDNPLIYSYVVSGGRLDLVSVYMFLGVFLLLLSIVFLVVWRWFR